MKNNVMKNDCIEPELGLYVLDWQQGWLDTDRTEDRARKEAVEGHLVRCSACMEGVALMDDLKTVLRQHPDLLDEPQQYLQAERPVRAVIPRWRAVAALAAGLAIGATLTLSWRPGGDMGGQGAASEAGALRQATSDKLAGARAAYTAGRYAEVVTALQSSAQTGDLSAEGLYYLGLANAGMGRRDMACEHLTQAVNRSTGALHEDARWALAQSLVAAGRPDLAHKHLAVLAQSARYAQQAATLAQALSQGPAGKN